MRQIEVGLDSYHHSNEESQLHVANLIDLATHRQDVSKLNSIFSPQTCQQILSIPLGLSSRLDRLVWRHIVLRQYTMKSGYYQALKKDNHEEAFSSVILENFWKKLWQIKSIPKCTHFAWRACMDILPVMLNLKRKRLADRYYLSQMWSAGRKYWSGSFIL